MLTEAAMGVVERVQGELGDDLTLLIGNGCCDSTAPFLFARYAPGPAEAPDRSRATASRVANRRRIRASSQATAAGPRAK